MASRRSNSVILISLVIWEILRFCVGWLSAISFTITTLTLSVSPPVTGTVSVAAVYLLWLGAPTLGMVAGFILLVSDMASGGGRGSIRTVLIMTKGFQSIIGLTGLLVIILSGGMFLVTDPALIFLGTSIALDCGAALLLGSSRAPHEGESVSASGSPDREHPTMERDV